MSGSAGSLARRLTEPVRRYTRWLHTRWPAGTVEKLPEVNEDGSTRVPGLYLVGDLTGIPLLKFSADTGARAVRTIVDDPDFRPTQDSDDEVRDLVIIGAGVAGMSAALEARENDLDFVVLEASEPFSTVVNFPRRKPIYTYPTDMQHAGEMHFHADVREDLLTELREQTIEQGIVPRPGRATSVQRSDGRLVVRLADAEPIRARRVIVAIGRSGDFRKLEVPGEELDKVSNRLHDPKDYADRDVLVVGGGC
jgi:thioredoxin reductase